MIRCEYRKAYCKARVIQVHGTEGRVLGRNQFPVGLVATWFTNRPRNQSSSHDRLIGESARFSGNGSMEHQRGSALAPPRWRSFVRVTCRQGAVRTIRGWWQRCSSISIIIIFCPFFLLSPSSVLDKSPEGCFWWRNDGLLTICYRVSS